MTFNHVHVQFRIPEHLKKKVHPSRTKQKKKEKRVVYHTELIYEL